MPPQIAFLPDSRLHLQHGPIDLLCRAWGDAGDIQAAYGRAAEMFADVLPDLCRELPHLRTPLPSPAPTGCVARAMHAACSPFSGFITPMAAVAGAVADHVLAAMCQVPLDRAYVNNGGDIAFHLAAGQSLRCGLVADLTAPALNGVFRLSAHQPSRGLATSGRACKGRGGRSFSFGIADAVTVLARSAAQADAAASIIANAVDLPGHQAVTRVPACAIDPDSDLGDLPVTRDLGHLTDRDIAAALDAGLCAADAALAAGLIDGAVLALRGRMLVCGLTIPALEPA